MPETKIKKKYPQIFWFFILRWLNGLLVFLSLRKSRKFWGVAYDSVSKQPLDPVIVKLLYAQSGEPVQTCVTDLAGRYGFLANPGKFKIFAKKSNYSFPSKKIRHDDDGIFTDVYRGEFFELFNESEVVGPNIPMDPIRSDWNQQAKLKLINTSPFLKLLLKRIIRVFFWFGFICALIFLFVDFYADFSLKFYSLSTAVLAGYTAILLLNSFLPNLRLWGRLYAGSGKRVIAGANLEIFNPQIPGVTLAKSITQEDGKFLLRANPGKYILRVKMNGKIWEIPVRVRGEGVINLDFCLVDNS